ncbi:MAG: phage late control D family protein [Gammaproteobacteria bacterium]
MGSYQIWLGGKPADNGFYDRLLSLDVEESADLPASLQLKLPVTRASDGELTEVGDAALAPYASIAVTVTPPDGAPSCIFDGYVLSQKVHMQSGVRGAWVEVYAQDASWLMKLEQKTREWAGATDALAAATIFGDYGITPAPENSQDDSGPYAEDAHTLMQRGTDYDFLQALARRAGRVMRIRCGATPGPRTGVFATPSLSGTPVATLRPNDTVAPNVREIDFEWDVMRPTEVLARQALLTDASPDGANGDSDSSGLAALDERDLPTFAGRALKVMLTGVADDAGQLKRKAQALLRESQWFARCNGSVELNALKKVLRAGDIVQVETVGSLYSGKYLAWSVLHSIRPAAYTMTFQLVRNAMGPAPKGAGIFGGLL